jgi:hypothetical protein
MKPCLLILMLLGVAVLSFEGCGFDERGASATDVFSLRTKCADLGEKIREKNDIVGNVVNQVSHYDPKTNRCYVRIDEDLGPGRSQKTISRGFSTDRRAKPSRPPELSAGTNQEISLVSG